MALPRTIWTYWEQGRDNAPPVVQRCFESWEYWNPGWTLQVLDRHTLSRHTDLEQRIDFSREDLTVTRRSDLIRASLLRAHGGVWADATVVCSQPLETWLTEYMATGFFAFRNPGHDRLCSNWFIAAEPDNALMAALETDYVALFAGIAPVEDPRLVTVVVINEPQGESYGGGSAAAPVFSRVTAGALRLLNLAPSSVPAADDAADMAAAPAVRGGGAA